MKPMREKVAPGAGEGGFGGRCDRSRIPISARLSRRGDGGQTVGRSGPRWQTNGFIKTFIRVGNPLGNLGGRGQEDSSPRGGSTADTGT